MLLFNSGTGVYRSVLPCFPLILCLFYAFFVLLPENTKESLEKVDFDLQTACGAPVCWSKYTTPACLISKKKHTRGESMKERQTGCVGVDRE